MLTIRLSRTGKKKAPQYRVVLMEKHRDPWSPAKEILGHYNPRAEKENIVLDKERIEYWLSQGAQPSNTVHNMLVNAGIVKADKQKSVRITNKRAKSIAEKQEELRAKEQEAKEAVKAAKEAEKAQQEERASEAQTAEEPQAQETPSTETPIETVPKETEEKPAE